MEELLCSFASRRHGLLVGHVRLLRFGRAHFSEEHHGANEFFRVVVGFAVVVFVPGHAHRFDEPFSQVVDETRLGAGHVGDQGLQHRSWASTRRSRSVVSGDAIGMARFILHRPRFPRAPGIHRHQGLPGQACAMSRSGASVPGMVAQPAAMSASRLW
jgi:hypothetical protein